MLTRLYIDNYRSFVNFECRFANKQLILGSNGSGKTSLFDVLATIRDFSAYGTQNDFMFVGATRTRWQDLPTQSFELETSHEDEHYTFRLTIDSGGQPARPRVVLEEVLHSGKPIFRFTKGEVQHYDDKYDPKVKYSFDPHRSALATITERRENKKLWSFKRWLGNLWFVSPDPHQMSGISDREASGPARNLGNFASWFRHLRLENDEDYQQLRQDLKEAIPGFQSMDLKEAGLGNRFLTVSFGDAEGNGKAAGTYGFGELSDGQRVLVGLYTLLNFGAKSGMTLCFDEPDNYIALSEIQPWLANLQDRIEQSGAQALIVSHHPELINQMAFQSGLVLDRPNGLHTRARDFHDSAKTGLPPAEIVARGWDHE